jgi:predicted DNA-binding transcriptional regulator AlpA
VRFITAKEVRELVSLSRTTLWRLCRAGLFPQPVKLSPGRIAFVREQVEDWMKARLNRDEPSPFTGIRAGDGESGPARDLSAGESGRPEVGSLIPSGRLSTLTAATSRRAPSSSQPGFAEDEMVEDVDTEELPGRAQAPGERHVLGRGLRVSGRAIVPDHKGAAPGQDRRLENLAWMNQRAREASDRDFVHAQQAVTDGQHGDHEDLAVDVANVPSE